MLPVSGSPGTYTVIFQNNLGSQPVTLGSSGAGLSGAGAAVSVSQVVAGTTVTAAIGSLDVRGGQVALGATPSNLTLGGNVTAVAGNGLSGTITGVVNNIGTGSLTLGTAAVTFTVVDSSSTQGLTVSAPITSGTGGSLVKAGPGTLTLAPPASNTYTGATTVSEGTLVLDATTAGVVTVPGNLQVGDFVGGVGLDVVQFATGSSSNQTVAGGAVTVNNSGLFNLNGLSDTIGALTLVGGTVNVPAGSTLTLSGNVARPGQRGQHQRGQSAGGAGVGCRHDSWRRQPCLDLHPELPRPVHAADRCSGRRTARGPW